MPMNDAKISAADMYIGVVVPSPGTLAARIGAMSPATLLRKLATPVPAPRTGAGLSHSQLISIFQPEAAMNAGSEKGRRIKSSQEGLTISPA